MLVEIHDRELKLIMFGGPVLTDTETKYATLNRKLLACFYALKKSEFLYVLGHKSL